MQPLQCNYLKNHLVEQSLGNGTVCLCQIAQTQVVLTFSYDTALLRGDGVLGPLAFPVLLLKNGEVAWDCEVMEVDNVVAPAQIEVCLLSLHDIRRPKADRVVLVQERETLGDEVLSVISLSPERLVQVGETSAEVDHGIRRIERERPDKVICPWLLAVATRVSERGR